MAHFCITCILDLRMASLIEYGYTDFRKCQRCREPVRDTQLSIVEKKGFAVELVKATFADMKGLDQAN
eukprot:gene16611-19731_t